MLLYHSFSNAAKNNPRFNSVSIREEQFNLAIHVWHLSPIFGEGMRFYNLPQWLYVTAPPNVLIDNLASTGIIGSLAFFFLVFVTVRTMLRFRLPWARSGWSSWSATTSTACSTSSGSVPCTVLPTSSAVSRWASPTAICESETRSRTCGGPGDR